MKHLINSYLEHLDKVDKDDHNFMKERELHKDKIDDTKLPIDKTNNYNSHIFVNY